MKPEQYFGRHDPDVLVKSASLQGVAIELDIVHDESGKSGM